MLKKNFGLLFYLKRRAGQAKSETAVYLRITVDGMSKEVSAKRSWPLSRWDARSGRAVGKGEDARSVNMLLDTMNLKAHGACRYLLDEGKEVTAEAIKNLLAGGHRSKVDLSIFNDHTNRLENW